MLSQKREEHETFQECDHSIVERARTVAASVAERAQVADKESELPAATARDLQEADLLAMYIPVALGGTEADLMTQLAVFELFGAACASTTWCLMNHTALCAIVQNVLGEQSAQYVHGVVR